MRPLEGRVLLASGATSGVGRAVVSAAAQAGAEIAVIVRWADADVSADVRALVESVTVAGGRCLIVAADLRAEAEVEHAVAEVVDHFGRLDAVVNTADAATPEGTLDTTSAVFRLMVDVNLHGTYLLGRTALPHLLESEHGQMVTVSPPVELSGDRLTPSMPWSVSKYAATLLTLGWAAEFEDLSFSANTLWPHRPIHEPGLVPVAPRSRRGPIFLPAIMGDAIIDLLSRPAGQVTGRSLLDAEVLQSSGLTDFTSYEWRPHPRHLTGVFPD